MPERLPRIIACHATGPGAVELDLEIRPELLWFQGHFPGSPILPGVVQIHWAVGFAQSHLGLDLPAAREIQIKFKAVITPGDPVTLALRHDAAKGRLAFEYRRHDAVCSIGTVFL